MKNLIISHYLLSQSNHKHDGKHTYLSLSVIYSTEETYGPNLHPDSEHGESTESQSGRKTFWQKLYLWNSFMAEGLILIGFVHKFLPDGCT